MVVYMRNSPGGISKGSVGWRKAAVDYLKGR